MNDIPKRLLETTIAVDGEDLDELLWHYPTPDVTTRAELPQVRLRHGDDTWVGAILGYGTSFEEAHTHMPGGRPASGERCSGCRWTDVTIMWAQPHDREDGPLAPSQYVVLIRGRSALPGETQRIRTTWTTDPVMVLDALRVPVPKRMRVTGNERSVAGPHEDALLDAALVDEPLAAVAASYERERAGAR